MALGRLFITEYSNFGDVMAESPCEPPTRTQIIDIGALSEELHPDTRIVVLYATFPCRIAMAVDHSLVPMPAWPLPEHTETFRRVRPNGRMRIAALDQELMT